MTAQADIRAKPLAGGSGSISDLRPPSESIRCAALRNWDAAVRDRPTPDISDWCDQRGNDYLRIPGLAYEQTFGIKFAAHRSANNADRRLNWTLNPGFLDYWLRKPKLLGGHPGSLDARGDLLEGYVACNIRRSVFRFHVFAER